MLNPNLLVRLFTGYIIIIMVSVTIVSVLASRQISKNSLADIEESLSIRSQLLVELAKPTFRNLSTPQLENIQETIVRLGANTQSRLTLIAPSGTVVADSQQAPQSMDNHAGRPEIIAAGKINKATAIRFSQTLQLQMLYLAQQVVENDNVLGYVRVSLPLSTIDKKLADLRISVLVSAIISAIIALILGFYFVKRFSDPLTKITRVAEAISKGDYSKRIVTTHKDEIGLLVEAFNRMAESSERRMDSIVADKNRLAMIFQGMVEGVIYVDETNHISHINQPAAKMLNLSISGAINQLVDEKIKAKEILSALEQAISTQNIIKVQMQHGDSIIKTEVIDIYAAALNNDIGEPIGAVIVLNNISELAYLETVRRDFVANASHELKTPITAIRGLTETRLDDKAMPEEIRNRFIEKIKVQSIRLSTLVADLMNISRLEASKSVPAFKPINLTQSVKCSIDHAWNICQEKQINLSNDLPKEQLMIEGDSQEISQLIDNLLDNAINYTSSLGNINVSLSRDNQQAKIVVKDTGIGISYNQQQRIFERFYRVDTARSRELGGTGLGLSIVKNIVEIHCGAIELKSKKNHGSTFTVYLPLI